MSSIGPLCPSLKRWLDEVSGVKLVIGHGGPNPHLMSPADAQMRNRDVVVELIARARFALAPTVCGQFEGPFGLMLNDLILLREQMSYMAGHADANGMPEAEWGAFVGNEISPALQRVASEWREKYPEAFTAEEAEHEVHS